MTLRIIWRSAIRLRTVALCALHAATLCPAISTADDWAQFNGPTRDGHLPAAYDLEKIPATGLKKLWSQAIGGGYSGIAVAQGRVFVTDFVVQVGEVRNDAGSVDNVKGIERIWCFDEKTGETIWRQEDNRSVSVSFAAGPRATPAVDGDLVYTLGSEGNLLALSVVNGKVAWQVSLKERYGAATPFWGYASSPLVHDDYLYTLAGGEGSVIVALDKHNGSEVWRAVSSKGIGYCPPTLIDSETQPQLLVWDAENLNSIDPITGKLFWREPLAPQYEMAIAPPLKLDDRLYVSGIGEVGKMFRLLPDRQGVETLWTGTPKTAVYCSNAAGIFLPGLLVGSDCGSGNLIGVDPDTGKRYWETMKPTSNTERRASHGTAFLFKGPANLFYMFSETGDFIIARLTPQGYDEVSRQKLIDATNSWQGRDVVWSYPAFANGNIYVRNDREIAAFDLTP